MAASWHDIEKTSHVDTLLLDVRTPDEYALGTIHYAINIPIDEIRSRFDEIPKNKRIIVFCGVGLRGYVACRILAQNATPGHIIEVKATDPSFASDVKSWSNMTGNKLLDVTQQSGVITARLQKQKLQK